MEEQKNSRCDIVQDLLPIYHDGELSAASTQLVEEHLAGCRICRAELAAYQKPLFSRKEILLDEAGPVKSVSLPLIFLSGWHKIAWIGIFVLAIGAGSLAWATYQSGKNTALQDPSFQRAVREGLFTPVHQTKQVGPYEITVTKLLLDPAGTVVFYHTDPEVGEMERPQLMLKDQQGKVYEPLSGYSYGGKEHVLELEPVDLKAQKLWLEFQVENTPVQESFTVDVEPGKVRASANEWWPGITRTMEPVRVDLERVVLGLTKTQVAIRSFWPLNQNIRGLGLGKLPPVGPVIGEDGQVKSASGGAYMIPPGAGIYSDYAMLRDNSNRRQLELNSVGYQTDSVSGGMKATFDFQPLSETTEEVYFTLPEIYLYRFVTSPEEIQISLSDGEEVNLNKKLFADTLEIHITKLKRQEGILEIYYRLPGAGSGSWPLYLPEIVLTVGDGFERGGRLKAVNGDEGMVELFVNGEGPWTIRLKSVGELLSGDREFTLPVPIAGY